MKPKISDALVSEQPQFVYKSFSENPAGFYEPKRNPGHVTMLQISTIARIKKSLIQIWATIMGKYTEVSTSAFSWCSTWKEFINFERYYNFKLSFLIPYQGKETQSLPPLRVSRVDKTRIRQNPLYSILSGTVLYKWLSNTSPHEIFWSVLRGGSGS